jgi:hypothetical protein
MRPVFAGPGFPGALSLAVMVFLLRWFTSSAVVHVVDSGNSSNLNYIPARVPTLSFEFKRYSVD